MIYYNIKKIHFINLDFFFWAVEEDSDSSEYDDEDDENAIVLAKKTDLWFINTGEYRYLMPIMIIVFSVLAVMLLIGKVVSLMLRRRGERYRQALLASKNSIVYQKLSEDIGGPTTPKFHRYTPIEQV